MEHLKRTLFYDRHVPLGARLVEFAGWEMPIQYGGGIVAEHLATRKRAGLFDVSHMGRFVLRGEGAPPFLQHVLTNNAANRDKDWRHFQADLPRFVSAELVDRSEEIAMLSLQGPRSRAILQSPIDEGDLPEPLRNYCSTVRIGGDVKDRVVDLRSRLLEMRYCFNEEHVGELLARLREQL